MKSELEFEPPLDSAPSSTLATTGVGFAGLGLVGWLGVLLALLFFIPYEVATVNSQNDALVVVENVFVALANVFWFFLRAIVGLVGIAINSTLSITGLVLGCLALGTRREPAAYTALGLGLAGLLLGAAIVVWRLWALGYFNQ